MKIADFLSCGQENAVHLRHLAAATGERPRAVRRMIERERRSGIPIVSDNVTGYWLASDQGEIERFARGMRSRAHEILRTAAAVERAAGPE